MVKKIKVTTPDCDKNFQELNELVPCKDVQTEKPKIKNLEEKLTTNINKNKLNDKIDNTELKCYVDENIGNANAYTNQVKSPFEDFIDDINHYKFSSVNMISDTLTNEIVDLFGEDILLDDNLRCEIAGLYQYCKNYPHKYDTYFPYLPYLKKYVNDKLLELQSKTITEEKPVKQLLNDIEMVNHPKHYNSYDKEVIDMMIDIWGPEETATFCKLNAFKYRMRMGTKPNNPFEQDLKKEQWYINKYHELLNNNNNKIVSDLH